MTKSFARPFAIPSCKRCHDNASGIRQELKLEHLGAVAFLVRTGAMPPFPFSVSEEERQTIDRLMGASEEPTQD